MKNNISFFLMTAVLLSFTACKENEPVGTQTYDASGILKHCAEDVITATYFDLHTNAVSLLAAIESLASDPTETNLENAKIAWRNTRKPWEQSEGFLFGPVSTKGIDPAIDSWPVNTIDLDAVLSGTDILTKTYIDGLEGTLKGFHTIEYLLWGADGNKAIADFTDREFEYMIGLCQSLEGETNELFTSWDAAGDNFQKNISFAGQAGSIYPSQRAALQELINGMIGIADEVANGKINDPYSTGDVTLEESRFSANSKADFADNIRSIQNIYIGTYAGNNGDGIYVFTAHFNQTFADALDAAIQEAIDAIEAIPGTFTEAILIHPEEVELAQEKVLEVKVMCESDLLPLLDEL